MMFDVNAQCEFNVAVRCETMHLLSLVGVGIACAAPGARSPLDGTNCLPHALIQNEMNAFHLVPLGHHVEHIKGTLLCSMC
jgi:hypothetical protein